MRIRLAEAVAAVGCVAVLVACGDRPAEQMTDLSGPSALPPSADPHLHLVVVDGDRQLGAAGGELPEPLTIRLETENGDGVPNVAVTWQVVSGGGTVAVPATRTDAEGFSRNHWTLGTDVRAAQRLDVSRPNPGAADEGIPAHFAATAAPGPVARVAVRSGTPELVRGTTLAPLRAVITDRFGNPIPERAADLSFHWTSSMPAVVEVLRADASAPDLAVHWPQLWEHDETKCADEAGSLGRGPHQCGPVTISLTARGAAGTFAASADVRPVACVFTLANAPPDPLPAGTAYELEFRTHDPSVGALDCMGLTVGHQAYLGDVSSTAEGLAVVAVDFAADRLYVRVRVLASATQGNVTVAPPAARPVTVALAGRP